MTEPPAVGAFLGAFPKVIEHLSAQLQGFSHA